MSDLPPIPPNIAHIAAPLLLGTLWNWCLYGVLIVQFYVYSYNFTEDKRSIKLLVYTVFLLETLQTALSGGDLYYWFISGYGDIRHLASPFASAFDVPIIESVVSLSVEVFFAYRIWVLSSVSTRRSSLRWYCLLICLFATINAAAAFTGGIYGFIHGSFVSGRTLRYIVMTWLIGNSMADILIAFAMFHHLVKQRKGTTRNGSFSDHHMVKIVRLTIESNLLTTSVGIVSLLLLFTYPNENWYTCPAAILGKLYSNTLLVSLNNRISIRKEAATRGIANRPPAMTLATTPGQNSNMNVAIMEIRAPPSTYKSTFFEGI